MSALDFAVKVKAIIDKASFQDGVRELEKLEQTSKRLIKGVAGFATAALSSATIAGEVAQQELKTARAIGVSTEALSGWKIACNVAGVSASGLIGTLASLENKMQHLKTGSFDMNLAKSLGMLGVGYGEFADMDTESRMRTVFNQANQMEDQQLAATLVGDILGQAGKDYYETLKMSGMSLEKQLAEAKKLNFVSERNRREAAVFASEMRSIKEAGKSITMMLGSEIASALTPTVRKVKNYLIQNRESIRKGIMGVAQTAGAVFNAIAGVIGKIAPFVEGLIDKFGGLDKILVKVGIGFASLKLLQLAGGIKQIISSINLLKAGLGGLGKGLLAGGVFLILEDIINHFMGGNSLIFDRIIPKLKEFADQMDFEDKVKRLTKAWSDLCDKFKDDKFQGALAKVVDFFKMLGGNLVKGTIEGLANGMDMLASLMQGDFKGYGKAWGREALRQAEYLGATMSGEDIEVYRARREKENSRDTAIHNAGKALEEGFKKYGISSHPFDKDARVNKENLPPEVKGLLQAYLNAGGDISNYGAYINDGIISPSGKVTQVAPDDWVFAVRNIGDLAAGLLPGVTNNNMNAPSNYVINQNFTFGAGVRPQEVRAAAYKGSSEALQSNLSNASRIMQLMPGTR